MVGRLDGLTFGTLEIKLNGLAVGLMARHVL
jgi:tetrahydromethanopterin S-methyltransferase subunit F